MQGHMAPAMEQPPTSEQMYQQAASYPLCLQMSLVSSDWYAPFAGAAVYKPAHAPVSDHMCYAVGFSEHNALPDKCIHQDFSQLYVSEADKRHCKDFMNNLRQKMADKERLDSDLVKGVLTDGRYLNQAKALYSRDKAASQDLVRALTDVMKYIRRRAPHDFENVKIMFLQEQPNELASIIKDMPTAKFGEELLRCAGLDPDAIRFLEINLSRLLANKAGCRCYKYVLEQANAHREEHRDLVKSIVEHIKVRIADYIKHANAGIVVTLVIDKFMSQQELQELCPKLCEFIHSDPYCSSGSLSYVIEAFCRKADVASVEELRNVHYRAAQDMFEPARQQARKQEDKKCPLDFVIGAYKAHDARLAAAAHPTATSPGPRTHEPAQLELRQIPLDAATRTNMSWADVCDDDLQEAVSATSSSWTTAASKTAHELGSPPATLEAALEAPPASKVPRRERRRSRQEPRCFNCRVRGHLAEFCPKATEASSTPTTSTPTTRCETDDEV